MKKNFTRSIALTILILGSFLTTTFVQVPQAERDALIALYNATGGASWTNNTNWNTAAPVSDWFGVTVGNDRIISLALQSNNLSGPISPQLTNLSNLQFLNLNSNNFAEFPDLSGLTNLVKVTLFDDIFTFEDIEPIVDFTSQHWTNNLLNENNC